MSPDATNFARDRQARDIATIQSLVANKHGFTVSELTGPRRPAALALTRQIAMTVCREVTGASYPDIARAFNKKHHWTACYACHEVALRRTKDPTFKEQYAALLAQAMNFTATKSIHG